MLKPVSMCSHNEEEYKIIHVQGAEKTHVNWGGSYRMNMGKFSKCDLIGCFQLVLVFQALLGSGK